PLIACIDSSIRIQRNHVEPCLVSRPSRVLPPEACTDGTSPAYEHRCRLSGNRCTLPISLRLGSAEEAPIPRSVHKGCASGSGCGCPSFGWAAWLVSAA